MKTVLINCSPRKRFCASAYFLFLQSLFLGGEKVKVTAVNKTAPQAPTNDMRAMMRRVAPGTPTTLWQPLPEGPVITIPAIRSAIYLYLMIPSPFVFP